MPDTKSPTKVSAAESIAGVMSAVSHVSKDGRNQQQNFNFRGIDAVMNAVGPALRDVGGFITPEVLKATYEHGSTSKGSATIEVRLRVKYSWYGTDGGEPVTSVVQAEATDMSDKATAKAMSVAYRTFLLQVLALPTDDPDPDADYIDRGAPGAKPAQAATASAPIATPPKDPSEDWWTLADDISTVPALEALHGRCRTLGELNTTKDDLGTADKYMRARKSMILADEAAAAAKATDWPVASIPSGEAA